MSIVRVDIGCETCKAVKDAERMSFNSAEFLIGVGLAMARSSELRLCEKHECLVKLAESCRE